MKRLLIATGAVLCLSGAAHASITPTLVSITPDGSDFDFNYSVTLSGDEGVTTGSQLVIFDFAGFVPGSIVSPSPLITVSTPLTANFDVTTGGVQLIGRRVSLAAGPCQLAERQNASVRFGKN